MLRLSKTKHEDTNKVIFEFFDELSHEQDQFDEDKANKVVFCINKTDRISLYAQAFVLFTATAYYVIREFAVKKFIYLDPNLAYLGMTSIQIIVELLLPNEIKAKHRKSRYKIIANFVMGVLFLALTYWYGYELWSQDGWPVKCSS